METLNMKIQRSPFKNVYWFARDLLNTDQYGGLGKSKEKNMLEAVALLENILVQEEMNDAEKLAVMKSILSEEISKMTKPNTKAAALAADLAQELDAKITNIDDVVIFCITMKYVVAPINHALAAVPSNDTEFSYKRSKHILDSLGEEKVGLVISTWDTLGQEGCLDAERAAVIEEFGKLLDNLTSLTIEHTAFDDNIVLTAFVQEFERRLGQKRKSRGGNSLETSVSFLFDYYKFKSSEKPSHFDQDLEVDKWFKCKDGWYIGISCKRTLRERWKQLSQASRDTLSHFKIREVWHLTTYDRDLSDDKIVKLGSQGQIFYLKDDSDVYKRCAAHDGMKNYVRPLSQLIKDIRSNIK